jgi:hypothetical protein
MRGSKAILLSTLVLSMGLMGCIRPDPDITSPVGTIPKITIDYIDNMTKVYVQPLDDHRYSSMTTRVFNGNVTYIEVTKNNTYLLSLETEEPVFTLNITVHDKEKVYAFEANLTVHPANEPDLVLLISIPTKKDEPKLKRVREEDLPWRTLADRAE